VSLGKYAVIVLAVVAVSLGGFWGLGGATLGPQALPAAALGAGLAAVNSLAAYALVLWSARRSTNAFLGAVLGGMVGRMGLMLAAVIVAVLVFGLPRIPLAVSLLGHFVVFLALELTVLHRRTSSPAEAAR
jgi:hypothetical protein